MKFTILFLSSLLFFYSSQKNLARRPVRIFHGLGDDCSNHFHPHENFKCVETGAGKKSFYNSIKTQAMIGCEILKSEVDILQPSFYVFAYSQGGLIARWIQLNCEGVGHLIKRMVLVGTPNLGIDKFPSSDAYYPKVYSSYQILDMIHGNKKYLNNLDQDVKKKIIDQLHQKAKPIQKEKSSYVYDAGIELAGWMSPVLRLLDLSLYSYFNENSKKAPLISSLSRDSSNRSLKTLDFLVVIANRDERVISPPESVTFGMKILDEKGSTIAKPQTSEFIKSHPMIRDMWLKNQLIVCLSDSSHAQLTFLEFKSILNILFKEDNTVKNYEDSLDMIKNRFLKEYPNYCAFNNPLNTKSKTYSEMTNEKTGLSNIDFALKKILI